MNRSTYCTGLLIASMLTSGISAQDNTWVNWGTTKAGLDTALAFNVFVTDINNDGYPDMVTLRGGWGVNAPNTLRAYINIRDTSSSDPSARMFVDVTETSGVNAPSPGATESKGVLVAALADVNNDGNVDLVRGAYYHADPATGPGERAEVLLGDGRGRFTIVPNNGLHGLGVINVAGMSFLDYDKDGNIDLFIARWFTHYQNNTWSPGILMKGNGDGTFTDVSAQAGITTPEPMYGCSVVDWNNDGWPDILTAPYCRTNGQLLKNNGDGTFTDVAAQTGYNARYMPGDGGQTMCLWSAVPEDYDNDGDMDFYFSLVHGGNDAHEGKSTIFINGGAAGNYNLAPDRSLIVKNQPFSSHNGDYDGSWLDIDNDGLMDLATVQGHYMPATDRLFIFQQGTDGKLTDITSDLGLIRAEAKDLHLLEAIDYDLDGDDDIVFCRNGQPRGLHLVENRIGQDNNWTGMSLHAPQGVNKSCIGARIHVWSGGTKRMREVHAGRGNNGGQQPFAMLFGLGSNTAIDSIRIDWPDAAGSRTVIKNPPINEYLGITKGGLSIADAKDETSTATLKAYPNPAGDFILVQFSDNKPIKQIDVYDMTGRRLRVHHPSASAQSVVYCALNGLNPGQYMISAITQEGDRIFMPFIKQP